MTAYHDEHENEHDLRAAPPCHALPPAEWCDRDGPGGFMGHTCYPPKLDQRVEGVLAEIAASFAKARKKHAPMRGPHEGYAILLEEVDELWDEVKRWQPDDQHVVAMRKEALHVAAMALAFLLEATP